MNYPEHDVRETLHTSTIPELSLAQHYATTSGIESDTHCHPGKASVSNDDLPCSALTEAKRRPPCLSGCQDRCDVQPADGPFIIRPKNWLTVINVGLETLTAPAY